MSNCAGAWRTMEWRGLASYGVVRCVKARTGQEWQGTDKSGINKYEEVESNGTGKR